MTGVMRGKHMFWIAAVLVLVLLAYAWIDGGREPVRSITQPVPVPERLG